MIHINITCNYRKNQFLGQNYYFVQAYQNNQISEKFLGKRWESLKISGAKGLNTNGDINTQMKDYYKGYNNFPPKFNKY